MDTFTITTPRLLLRKVTPETYKEVFTQYSDPEIMSFFGHQSREELVIERDRYEKGLSTFNKTVLYFHMIEHSSSRVIGSCGFHTVYTQHARAEVYYWINKEEDRRKGYGTEAFAEVLKYGFGEMNLNRIEAFIGPDNVASRKLLDKFGFIEEGRMRKHYFINNEFGDSIMLSLLKEEF